MLNIDRKVKRRISFIAKLTALIVHVIINSYSFVVGVFGIASITYGALLIYQPAAYLVCGGSLIFHSWYMAKFIATQKGVK